MNTFMSDNAADSDTVADTWEWAEWEHADMMCIIYSSSNDAEKHSVHDTTI